MKGRRIGKLNERPGSGACGVLLEKFGDGAVLGLLWLSSEADAESLIDFLGSGGWVEGSKFQDFRASSFLAEQDKEGVTS